MAIDSDSEYPLYQSTPNVAKAITVTIGTKTALIRSARRAIGALVLCASITIEVIRAYSVSRPTRVARTIRRPFVFTELPITRSPGPTVNGSDSPVINELSTELLPETTTPSVATRSPGTTTNSSPISKFSTGIRAVNPPRITLTSLTFRAKSAESALLARRFARVSRNLPRMTKVTTPAATSV